MSVSKGRLGRGGLAFLGGYLCCLAAFEWAQCWEFSPFSFRPQVAVTTSLAMWTSLCEQQSVPGRRSVLATPALLWIALAAWPLPMTLSTSAALFSLLVVVLALATLPRRRAALAMGLTLLLAIGAVHGLPAWPVGAGLLVAAAAESAAARRRKPIESGLEARHRLTAEAQSRTAIISWQGFADLFKATAPGEGERFTSSLLDDTHRIIERCGGRRVKNHGEGGLYRFPNEGSLNRCVGQLESYRSQVVEVLGQAQAPPVELVVSVN